MVNAAVNLVGTGSADALAGTSFNDTFRGAGGNDVINGGGGTDTASFSGTRASYRLFNTGTSVTVTDSQAGRDGIDSVSSVERLAFTDMTINLEIGAKSRTVTAAQLKTLEELYVAFFNRVPDADGLAFWIDQAASGLPVNSIADSFYGAALLYPSLTGYTNSMGNGSFVNVIYRNVLGRADGGDAEGVAFWSNALTTGAQTRGDLVTAMLGSAHTFKGNATYGYVADLLDNKAMVAQRFAVELGINYNNPELSISNGMAIASAVTPTSTTAAIGLIGITDGFSTV